MILRIRKNLVFDRYLSWQKNNATAARASMELFFNPNSNSINLKATVKKLKEENSPFYIGIHNFLQLLYIKFFSVGFQIKSCKFLGGGKISLLMIYAGLSVFSKSSQVKHLIPKTVCQPFFNELLAIVSNDFKDQEKPSF